MTGEEFVALREPPFDLEIGACLEASMASVIESVRPMGRA
jgi:hypothetical protein